MSEGDGSPRVGKRTAENQLIKENADRNDGENTTAGTFPRASAEVMKGRRIFKARRPTVQTGGDSGSARPNAFSGFSIGSNTSTSSAQAPAASPTSEPLSTPTPAPGPAPAPTPASTLAPSSEPPPDASQVTSSAPKQSDSAAVSKGGDVSAEELEETAGASSAGLPVPSTSVSGSDDAERTELSKDGDNGSGEGETPEGGGGAAKREEKEEKEKEPAEAANGKEGEDKSETTATSSPAPAPAPATMPPPSQLGFGISPFQSALANPAAPLSFSGFGTTPSSSPNLAAPVSRGALSGFGSFGGAATTAGGGGALSFNTFASATASGTWGSNSVTKQNGGEVLRKLEPPPKDGKDDTEDRGEGNGAAEEGWKAKAEENGKAHGVSSRVVMRREAGHQVVLNVSLNGKVICAKQGEKAVRLSCFTPNGPATYLLKVKLSEDADSILTAIQSHTIKPSSST